jgi:hypothetical protein
LGKRLQTYRYHDVSKQDELTTNDNGIDIISHQLELQFKGNKPIFISWATVEGWRQYSLCVSEASFCTGAEIFSKKDSNWSAILGSRFEDFEIYGYKENTTTTTDYSTGRSWDNVYYDQPHLIILRFENGNMLGIANFYFEENFEPELPMGDDVWIILNQPRIDACSSKLSLELLYTC